MSVGTHVAGRNLSAYHQVELGVDLRVLVTPRLIGLVSMMRIATTGIVFRRLTVQLSDGRGSDDGCVI